MGDIPDQRSVLPPKIAALFGADPNLYE